MRLAAEYLPRAVADGNDMEARAHMMAVAAMGATAFQKGLGGVHALSHAIGALHDTHHGLTNAVLMPYVVRQNRSAIERQMELLARVRDLGKAGYEGVFEWIRALGEKLHIPHRATALGADASEAREIGARAIKDPTARGNPIPLSAETYAAIFVRACAGAL